MWRTLRRAIVLNCIVRAIVYYMEGVAWWKSVGTYKSVGRLSYAVSKEDVLRSVDY